MSGVIISPSGGQALVTAQPSDAELAKLEEGRKQLILQLDAMRDQGRHMIELHCGPDRSSWVPWKGIVTFWFQGASMSGAADVSLYICPHCNTPYYKESYTSLPELRNNGEVWQSGYHVCLHCNRSTPEEQVHGQIFARLHVQHWAELLATWCGRMGYDCDLRLVYARTDIRKVVEKEAERPNKGEALRRAEYVDREPQRYRWKRLMADSNTRGMVSAIRGFLTA